MRLFEHTFRAGNDSVDRCVTRVSFGLSHAVHNLQLVGVDVEQCTEESADQKSAQDLIVKLGLVPKDSEPTG